MIWVALFLAVANMIALGLMARALSERMIALKAELIDLRARLTVVEDDKRKHQAQINTLYDRE